jgi:hypothetical protein
MAVMPFGKHQGWDLTEVPTNYLLWLTRKQPPLYGWLAAAVAEELRARRGDRQSRSWPTPSVSSCPDRELAAEIITAGHHVLTRKWHPDVGGSGEVMTRVNVVSEWLKKMALGVLPR